MATLHFARALYDFLEVFLYFHLQHFSLWSWRGSPLDVKLQTGTTVLLSYGPGSLPIRTLCSNTGMYRYIGVVLHSHVCAYTFNYKYTNTSLV